MKRHPKRARPLWGCAKPKAPIRYIYGPLSVAIEGEDITGANVREVIEWPEGQATITTATKFKGSPRITFAQSKMRADLKVKVTFSTDGNAPPPPDGAYFLAVDSEGGPVANFARAVGQ